MLDRIMWNIFKKTGNVNAYLYMNEHRKYYPDGNVENRIQQEPLEIKEITIP